MNEQKTVNPGTRPDLESSLTELFHAPSPQPGFVSQLERSLLDRACQSGRPSLRQRLSSLLASSKTGLAWAVGALLLVVALSWGIRNLIPAVLPAQKQTPTPGGPAGGLLISGSYSGLEIPDDLVIYRILTSEGVEAGSGERRGNGPWRAQIPGAPDGVRFTITAEAVGYAVSPASYELIVQEGRAYFWQGGQPGHLAEALNFAFSRPGEGWETFTWENGFSISYPGDWSVEASPYSVSLRKGPYRLLIAFRRPEQSHAIQPTGLPSGEFIQAGSVTFLDQEIDRTELVQDGRVKRVLYNGAREIQFKDISFVLMLEASQAEAASFDIPQDVQAIADQVLASFSMPDLQPLPEILATKGLGRVAFIQAGDVRIKALPEGEPIRLTSDGSNSSPLWSPSGRWLAYRHGEGQLSLIRVDGSGAHRLEMEPVIVYAWSPTADRLAFSLGGEREGELWVVNADGTGMVNVVPRQEIGDGSGKAGHAGNFLWHPLGGLLIYEWWVGAPGEAPVEQGLREVNAFSGEEMREFYTRGTPSDPEILLAGWLAEGKLLLGWQGYQGSASLLADGAPLWQLPYGPEGQAGLAGPVGPITETLSFTDYLSPDPSNTGRLAAISGVGREAWAGKSLYLHEYATGRGQNLTGADQAAAFPAFSPDGQRLAYVSTPGQEAGLEGEALAQAMLARRLWLIDFPADTPDVPGAPRQLTSDPNYRDERPAWSRDGQYLLFPRLDQGGNASLWLFPLAGDGPLPVVASLETAVESLSYYGHIDWGLYFDWWQPPAAAPDEYPPQPEMPETAATPAATLAPPAASFSEPAAGYAFDYPEGWHLNSVPGSTQASSSDPATWAVKGSLPPGQTQVVFIDDAALQGASFEDVRAATFKSIDLAGELVLREEIWAMPGGVAAVRLLVSGPDGEYAMLVTVLNGAPLQVKGYGDLALFDAIIATLRGGN